MAERLDETINMSEEMRFRKRNKKLRMKLEKSVHFNSTEVERILMIYYHLQRENKEKKKMVKKGQFRDILHCGFDMTDAKFNEKVITALEYGIPVIASQVGMPVFVKTFSLFLRGTMEEKMEHCFRTYDQQGDGFLVKEGLFNCLKGSLISAVSEDDADEAVRDMLELVMKKMDIDRDNKISFKDYKTTIERDPMMLETFGQCLPSRIAVHTMQYTLFENVGKV